jgi:hypothetical protein
MDFALKKLSRGGVSAALKKAERYRLLNEAWEAESICLDILEIEPENQEALVMLLLARTDQLGSEQGASIADAQEVVARLHGEYERAYYSGIICERRAAAFLARDRSGAGKVAYQWFRRAMEWYEKAETSRSAGNDDALLRWNTCARAIMRHPNVKPDEREEAPQLLE